MVGCTGDSQIVISNVELEKLIVKVFKAIDSPVDVRSLRSYVMSRLPIMDIYLVPVGGSKMTTKMNGGTFELCDTRENPEENVMRSEGGIEGVGFVDNFCKIYINRCAEKPNNMIE